MKTGVFESESVEFVFPYPLDHVMDKLSERVLNPRQPQSSVECMVGNVSSGSTYLYRSVPGSKNSFRPTFYGKFRGTEDSTTLTGEICLNRVVKKFIIVWCAIVGLVVVFTLLTVLGNPAASWGSVIYIVLMLIACIAFFRFMIGKSKSDTVWIKESIQRAIADDH